MAIVSRQIVKQTPTRRRARHFSLDPFSAIAADLRRQD
jgi:hypothetical protein